jgi:hypothetical protein
MVFTPDDRTFAFTPGGLVFVEGNDDWDGCMPVSFKENFEEKFLKMYV